METNASQLRFLEKRRRTRASDLSFLYPMKCKSLVIYDLKTIMMSSGHLRSISLLVPGCDWRMEASVACMGSFGAFLLYGSYF